MEEVGGSSLSVSTINFESYSVARVAAFFGLQKEFIKLRRIFAEIFLLEEDFFCRKKFLIG